MHDFDFSTEPSPARPLRRAFAVALAFSVCLHIAVVPQLELFIRPKLVTPPLASVKLILTAAKPPAPSDPPADAITNTPAGTEAPASSPAPDTGTVPEIRDTPPTSPPEAKRTEATATIAAPLPRISREALSAIAAESISDEQGASPPTMNGTIADPRLRDKLAQIRAQQSPLDLVTQPEAAASFDGAGWSEFVQMGSRCFRVVAADPLTPGSTEMWYREKCPG